MDPRVSTSSFARMPVATACSLATIRPHTLRPPVVTWLTPASRAKSFAVEKFAAAEWVVIAHHLLNSS